MKKRPKGKRLPPPTRAEMLEALPGLLLRGFGQATPLEEVAMVTLGLPVRSLCRGMTEDELKNYSTSQSASGPLHSVRLQRKP